jgi:hypothetical protein
MVDCYYTQGSGDRRFDVNAGLAPVAYKAIALLLSYNRASEFTVGSHDFFPPS